MAEKYECEEEDCYQYAVSFPIDKDGKQRYFCFEHYHLYGRKIAQEECKKMGLDTPEKQKAWCREQLKHFLTKKVRRSR